MASNRALSARDVYRMADERIGTHLVEHGFERQQDGEYLRKSADGMDRILFDGDDRKSKVAVLAGYYPADLAFMDDFLHGEDRGFPVGPYLSQHGMSSRPSAWSYATRERAEKSLAEIDRAIPQVTLPWLRDLRDPAKYAEAVDENALLYKAAAYERAGRLDLARQFYEALFERFRMMLAQFDEAMVMREAGQQFIYVAEKLGREQAIASRFREKLRYTRPVTPLG